MGVLLLWSALLPVSVSPVAASPDPNPITLENQLPGTVAWRLGVAPGTQTANDVEKQVKGYASATSVNKGQSIDLMVTVNPAQSVTVQIFRMGWYQGLGGRLVATVGPIPAVAQPACPMQPDTGLIECAWNPTTTLSVPPDWTSGIYLALLTNAQGFQNYIQFVVRDDARPADLLYQQSVATYQAYNNYPNDGSKSCGSTIPATGKNLYDNQSSAPTTISTKPRAVKVSFDRPYACSGADDLVSADWSWELYFIRWLEKSGYDVAYSTNLDTHEHGERLRSYKGFLSVGHDEYWSGAMFDAAEAARDAGVNLAFLGSNDVYWQVRFEPSTAGVADRVMVGYKNTPTNTYSTVDPISDPTKRTVRFQDPPVNRPPQQLIGSSFVSSTGRSVLNTDLVLRNSTHWIFSGTSVSDGDRVPGLVGYEADGVSCHYPLPANQSYTLLSDSNFVDSDDLTRSSNAAIYQAPSGAWVFNAGTMSWSWGLDDKVDPRDPTRTTTLGDARIAQMTKNLLDVFIGASTPGAAPASAPDCSYDRSMSFEGGISTGTDGANRVIGSVGINSATPIHGSGSASINGAQSYLDELTTAVDDLSVAFSLRLAQKPTVDVRLGVISSLVSDAGNLVLRANSNGTTTLQLRNGSVRVGSDSPPLAVGTTYHLRIRQVRGLGADAVLQAWVQPADQLEGAPFAQTTAGAWTTRADRVRLGSTTNNSTTPPVLNADIDDVRILGKPASIAATQPAAPTGLTASAVNETRVSLSWVDASNDESGFVLQRCSGSCATWAPVGPGTARGNHLLRRPNRVSLHRLPVPGRSRERQRAVTLVPGSHNYHPISSTAYADRVHGGAVIADHGGRVVGSGPGGQQRAGAAGLELVVLRLGDQHGGPGIDDVH